MYKIVHIGSCRFSRHSLSMETISHDYESTGPLPPPPPHTHTENCVCDVSICKSEGGDFIRNAAKMFSFDPIPTRTKKAWSSSTCLLYDLHRSHAGPDPDMTFHFFYADPDSDRTLRFTHVEKFFFYIHSRACQHCIIFLVGVLGVIIFIILNSILKFSGQNYIVQLFWTFRWNGYQYPPDPDWQAMDGSPAKWYRSERIRIHKNTACQAPQNDFRWWKSSKHDMTEYYSENVRYL